MVFLSRVLAILWPYLVMMTLNCTLVVEGRGELNPERPRPPAVTALATLCR